MQANIAANNVANIDAYLQVYTHPRGGNGLRMRRVRVSGSRIFDDVAPILLINTNVAWESWQNDAAGAQINWMATERVQAQTATGRLHAALNNLAQPQQAIFRTLWWADPTATNQNRRDYSIFQKNAFSVPGWDPVHNRQGAFLAVYHHISRINHSCRPNAVMSIHEATGHTDIILIRRLNRYEEITIDYIENNWLETWAQRSQRLQHHNGFQCTCVDCIGAAERTYGNDIRRSIRVATDTVEARWTHWTDSQRADDLAALAKRANMTELLVGKSDKWVTAMLVLAQGHVQAGNREAAYSVTKQAWDGYKSIYTVHGIRMPELDTLLGDRGLR